MGRSCSGSGMSTRYGESRYSRAGSASGSDRDTANDWQIWKGQECLCNDGKSWGGGRPAKPPVATNSTAAESSHPPGATWEVVVEVIKAAGIYANPDTGNFPDEEARA